MSRLRRFRRYESTVAALSPWEKKIYDDLSDAAEAEFIDPVAAPSWGRHLAMALSVAGCLALAVFVGVMAFAMHGGHLAFSEASGEAAFWAALVFSGGLGVGIILAVVDFREGLASVERVFGRDLDGDGRVGRQSLRCEVHLPEQKKSLIFDLPCSEAQLRILANGVLTDGDLSYGAWAGKGRLFSRPVFTALRKTLLNRGLLESIDASRKNAPLRLTRPGRAFFEHLAADEA